jgi:hypothetical protein
MRFQLSIMAFALALVAAPAGRIELQAATPTVTLGAIRSQLGQLFASWDLNGDGFLDKEELAKAFRGPSAKPFDYKKPENQKAASPSLSFLPSAVLTSTPSLASSFSVAQPYSASLALVAYFARPNTDKPAKPSKPVDYTNYPDYIFLKNLDKNGDEKISKKEWDAWARDYSRQLKALQDLQNKILKAQQRLAAAATIASQRKAQAELKKLQKDLAAFSKKMAAYEKKLQQAMKGRN